MAETEVDVAGPLTLEEAKAVGDVPEDFAVAQDQRKPSMIEKAAAALVGVHKDDTIKEESEEAVTTTEAAAAADTTEADGTPEKRVSFLEDPVQKEPEVEKPKQKSFLGFLSRRKSESESTTGQDTTATKTDDVVADGETTEDKGKTKSKSFLDGIFHRGSKEVTPTTGNTETTTTGTGTTEEGHGGAAAAVAAGAAAVTAAGVAAGVVAADATEEKTTDETPVVTETATTTPAEETTAVETGETTAAAAEETPVVAAETEATPTAQNVPEGTTVVKQGTCQKQSRICKKWRYRHIRLLSDATMQYSKTEDFKSVKGMTLADVEVTTSTGKAPADYILTIKGKGKMVLGFAEEAERDAWANVVTDIKARAFAAERSNAEDGQEQVLKSSQVDETEAAGTGEVATTEEATATATENATEEPTTPEEPQQE